MSSFVVVIDTCSLFPTTLREVLLGAAEEGLYRLRWSEKILDDLSRNLITNRGLSQGQAEHLLSEMRKAFPEAVVTGHEGLVPSMANHPKDRHVLAAAVRCAAQVIVTDNLKDFPNKALDPHNVEAQSPDEFLGYLFDLYPDEMLRVILKANISRKRPPERLSTTLDRLGKSAPSFVTQLRGQQQIAHILEAE